MYLANYTAVTKLYKIGKGDDANIPNIVYASESGKVMKTQSF